MNSSLAVAYIEPQGVVQLERDSYSGIEGREVRDSNLRMGAGRRKGRISMHTPDLSLTMHSRTTWDVKLGLASFPGNQP